MKRIICHWSAGKYKASSIDRKHYHFIFEDDGREVRGNWPVSANAKIRKGKYAAHTARCNTGSIGLSCACMWNARENDFGDYPMTETQFEAMCAKAAKLCKQYGIPVTRKTVLSHAEVQPTLRIKQAGKWDFTRLPFKPSLRGAIKCGDYMRGRVKAYQAGTQMIGLLQPVGDDIQDRNFNTSEDPNDIKLRLGMENPLVGELQDLLNEKGYSCGRADEIFGKETRGAVLRMKADNGMSTASEAISINEAEACGPREVGIERAEANTAQVIERSQTAQMANEAMKADVGKVAAGVGTTVAAVGIPSPQAALEKAQDGLDKAEQGKEVLTRSQDMLQQVTGGAIDLKTVLVVLGVLITIAALYGAYKSRGALMRRVQDYNSGKNL